MERKLSRLTDGRIIDTSPMDKGDWPLMVASPDEGWVTYEDNMWAVYDAVPMTDEEIGDLIFSGELDFYINITLEARKRVREIEKSYQELRPDYTPGICRDLALYAFFSERLKNTPKQKRAQKPSE